MAELDLMQSVINSAWERARLDWPRAPKLIAEQLRKLPSAQRAEAKETVYGLIRKKAALDWIISDAGLPKKDFATRIEVYRSLWGERETQDADPALASSLGKLQGLSTDKRLSAEYGVPEWLTKEWTKAFGSQALQLAQALSHPAPVDLWISPAKSSRESAIELLRERGVECRPTQYSSLGVRVDQSHAGLLRDEKLADLFTVQDEGSQLIGELVAPSPGDTVVDYCAGAGGKTLGLAAALGGSGRLFAFDTRSAALREARKRLSRLGYNGVTCEVFGKGQSERQLFGEADRVLVDAPCSALGTLRRHPEMLHRAAPTSIQRFAELQLDICMSASKLLKKGGVLIYATCTLTAAENQHNIKRIAAKTKLRVVPTTEWCEAPWIESLSRDNYLQLLPHVSNTDGFFAAVLQKD